MQSSFSWDWGPAFPTQGIWKSIGLEFLTNNSTIIKEMFAQTIWNQSNSTWSLNVTLLVHQSVAHDVQLNIHLNEHQLYKKEIKLKSDDQMIVQHPFSAERSFFLRLTLSRAELGVTILREIKS